jgi:CelD/BcsL family acetyltransferase involved in cellulose biosynthesis
LSNERDLPDRGDTRLVFEIIDDSASFAALRESWETLFARAAVPHFFQRFEWLWAAWRYVAEPKGRRLLILVGRSEGRVVLIWPLMRQDRGLIRFLASDRGEYRDILVEAGPAAERWVGEAYDRLVAMDDVNILHLQDIRPVSVLARHVAARGIGARTFVWPAVAIGLGAWRGFAQYLEGRSRNLRLDQGRQWRRFAKLGDPAFVSVLDRTAAGETIAWIYKRKIEWQQERGISNPSFSCDEYRSFIVEASLAAFDAGALHVSQLRVGGTLRQPGSAIWHRVNTPSTCLRMTARWSAIRPVDC